MKFTMKHALAVLAATNMAAFAQVIPGVTLDSFSSQISVVDRLAINTLDAGGLTGGGGLSTDTHGANANDMWLTAGSIVGLGGIDYNPTITFNLGGLYDVNTLRIWNFNETGFTKHGANQISVSAGATLATLTQLQTINVAQAGGTGAEAAQDFASVFTGVQFIRFTIDSNWDGDDFVTDTFAPEGSAEQFAGLSEVRFEGAVVPEPGTLSLMAVMGAALLARRKY